MTKIKGTKRALLSSVLALVLCFSMLIGTTFAWFTDSVTSGRNTIQSGNLDVVLEYWDGDSYEEVTSTTKLFNDAALWEPGHTEVAYLKVSNAGSLALKYQMAVNVYNETLGKTKATADIKLSDHLQFKVVESDTDLADTYTRETAKNANVPATKLQTYNSKIKELESKNEQGDNNYYDYVALIIYMPETVGNEANHDGVNIPSIEMGVDLFATQFTYEEDSFNNQYDAGAPIVWTGDADIDWYLADPSATEFEISTAEELAGFAAIVNGTAEGVAQDTFSGQTVKLTKNIDLGDALWTPIGLAKASSFSGTFDGQGNTVYNLHIDIDDDRDYGGLFGITNTAKIQGLTIRNVDINAYKNVGAVVGYNLSGTVSDCHVEGDINIVARYAFVGGIVGNGYCSVENCSVIADGTGKITAMAVAGGITGRIQEGSYSIKNCVVKNMDISSDEQVGAISGFLHYSNIVSDCVAENINLTLTATAEQAPAIGLATGLYSYNASKPITITNNTFKNITLSAAAAVTGTTDILYGCDYDHSSNTNFILDNNIQENITNTLIYK